MKKIIYLLAFLTLGTAGYAQGYQVGDQVKDFTYATASGKMQSLSRAYSNSKGVILVFTCNTCPFAKAYEARIIGLHKKYASMGYPVLAINPNIQKGDTQKDIADRIKAKKIPYEYVLDHKDAPVYKQFNAQKTPEVFLLQKKDDGFFLAYTGTIDDNYEDESAVTKRYVSDAIDALLSDRAVPMTKTVAIGCTVKGRN